MFVKPGINPETGAPFRVRIPRTFALLAEDGQEVADDYFWRWMLHHKDVVECEPPAPATAPVDSTDPAPAPASVESDTPALQDGEPLRLTAAEWAKIGDAKLGDPSGPAEMGFTTAEAIHDRDPTAPLMTHDEYLAAQPVSEG